MDNNNQKPTPQTEPVFRVHRTEMLCPNCLGKMLIQESPTEAYCDACGQYFYKKEGELIAKYK
jgi:hypothetical protein